jgi:hypothetical protein
MNAAIEVQVSVAERALITLRKSIDSADRPSVAVFIDPVLGDAVLDVDGVMNGLSSGEVRRIKLPPIHEDIDPERSPYLLFMADEERAERVLNATVRHAAQEAVGAPSALGASRSVCGWVVGEPDARDLAHRLADAAQVLRPDGTRWPLRFWDPRVLWHLPNTLSPHDWRQLQNAIGAWHALDPSHTLVAYAPSSPAPTQRRSAPLKFDEPGWASLERIGTINVALATAREWGVIPTQGNAERVRRLLQVCEGFGFHGERDGLAFVACGLTSHDRFYEDERVDQALRRASASGEGVVSALSAFDDHFWNQLASRA